MAEEYPLMERYITPWKDILPEGILPPAQQGIIEKYFARGFLYCLFPTACPYCGLHKGEGVFLCNM